MRNYLILLLILFTTSNLLAGEISNSNKNKTSKLISGKIIDKISGEEIAGAQVKYKDQLIYADLNGNFSISISTDTKEALVSSISYNDVVITFDPLSYTNLIVQLESK